MEEILTADALRCYRQKNWETPFILRGKAGERIFVHGTRDQCRFLFEMLSGLRTPDAGKVRVLGQDLYSLPESELAIFRREKIGAIPQGGGFLPEFSLLEQLLWPLRLSGQEMEVLRSRIQALDLRYFPTRWICAIFPPTTSTIQPSDVPSGPEVWLSSSGQPCSSPS